MKILGAKSQEGEGGIYDRIVYDWINYAMIHKNLESIESEG